MKSPLLATAWLLLIPCAAMAQSGATIVSAEQVEQIRAAARAAQAPNGVIVVSAQQVDQIRQNAKAAQAGKPGSSLPIIAATGCSIRNSAMAASPSSKATS